MKKHFITLFTILLSSITFVNAQSAPTRGVAKVQNAVVEYTQTFLGKKSGENITLVAEGKSAFIELNDFESLFMDYKDSVLYSMCELNGRKFSTKQHFSIGKNLTKIGVDTILNWTCVKYQTSVNSNTIHIWATQDLGFCGTPIPGYGVPGGLVLKVERNGNTTTEAISIQRGTLPQDIRPADFGEIIDPVQYRWEVQNKDVKVVNVFKDNMIGFNGAKGPESFDQNNYDTIYTLGGGSVLLRKVRLPKDIEKYSIFADLKQQAVGDAYDRTGTIFMIPMDGEVTYLDALSSAKGAGMSNMPAFEADKSDSMRYPAIIATKGYKPPVELMRFFTPFGVGGYNHIKVKGQSWTDSVVYRSEITHLTPMLSDGEAWIGVYIGNWTNNGHKVSLDLKFHPNTRNPKPENAPKNVVVPLFNTVTIMEQGGGQTYPTFFGKRPLVVKFYLEQEIKNPILVYTTSGHGGWAGGDEFNPKNNIISLDKKVVMNYTPWRGDCASYRGWNPSSGNFSNGLSSSDLSRSSWCPGTVTNPVYIELSSGKNKVLKAGWHTITVEIPQGESVGNSFSYWCVSGVIIGQQ